MGAPGALHYQEPRQRLPASDPLGTPSSHQSQHLFPSPSCGRTACWPPDPAEAADATGQALPLGVQAHSASATTGFPGDTITESGDTFKQMCKCVCPLCWEATVAANTSEHENIPPTAFISLCHPPCPHLQLKNSLLIQFANLPVSLSQEYLRRCKAVQSDCLNRLIKHPARYGKSAS